MVLPNGLPDILASMMQNPEIMKTVSSIAENVKAPDIPMQSPPANEDSNTESPPSQGTFGGISIPPELLAQLPSIMASLSQSNNDSTLPESGPPEHSASAYNNQRKALLYALKPFLSKKRCAVIDSLLKFEGLAGVLTTFNSKEL